MKYTITILIFLMLFVNTAVAVTYTATVPKDLDVTTPTEGSTPPREMNDSVREVKVVEKNQYIMLSVGTTTTLTGTSTFIIGSSSTALTLNFPTASTIATSTCTKEYVILNRNTGTVTLNIAVEGIAGSPTVSQNNGILLYTDGTTWFEKRVQNAYNATNFGNIGTSSFARSGANSDITAITGLTTYLATGQGGSGTNTPAGAASAFGVGTEDSPEFTGLNVTSTGTITHFGATNGTITNLLATRGTVTTLYSTTGNITNQTTTTGTITTLNSTTGNVTNLVTTTGTVTTLNSTTGNITTGNITNQVTTTGTVTTLNSTTGNVTNLNTTTGTVTTLNSTTGNVTNQVTTTGTITTLYNTNLTTTTGTITTLNNTNLAGGSGTFTGNVQAASVTGFNYLQSWTTGSQTTAATGTVRFNSTGDIITSSTYDGNGNGTITTALSAGVSAKPDAQVDSVVQVSNPTAYDFPGAFVSIAASGTAAAITFKKPSLATQTSGLVSLATQTTGLVSFGTQTTGLLSIATQTTGVAFSGVTGSATSAQLPSNPTFVGTLTSSIGIFGTTTQRNASVMTICGTATSPLSIVMNIVLGTHTTALMTSNTAPSPYVVSASAETVNYEAYKAFDRNASSEFSTPAGFPQWIKYNFGSTTTKAMQNYRIAVTLGASNPKDFAYQVSSDDTTWVTISSIVGETSWATGVYNTYVIATSTVAYQFHRVYITAITGADDHPQIAELNFIERDRGADAVYIDSNGTMILGTITPSSSGTAYKLQISGSGLAASWGVTCYGSIKSIIGSGSDIINEGYEAVMGTKLFKHHPKTRDDITLVYAEKIAKSEYVGNFTKVDFETFKTDRLGSYTSYDVNGSSTVDWTRLNDDFQMQYVKPREDEFYVLLDMNKRINDKKVDLESDTSVTNITPISDHESTPDLFKRHDKKILDLEPQIGALMATVQYQDAQVKSQQDEIGSLTVALENQRIVYNEEVDNLYKVINAIIVALLAVGGVSGWSTMRRKRKGT